MAMDAQYDYVIMQLMVGNMIMMYEYAIKKDHSKFAKEVRKCHNPILMLVISGIASMHHI